MILLDTQTLIWLLFDEQRLGPRARRTIDQAWPLAETAVSAITFWEIAMLHEKQRLALLADAGSWRASLLADGLVEIPLDGSVGIRAATLQDFHRDPADRIIVATALEGHQLVTSDRRILAWPGNLRRVDATL